MHFFPWQDPTQLQQMMAQMQQQLWANLHAASAINGAATPTSGNSMLEPSGSPFMTAATATSPLALFAANATTTAALANGNGGRFLEFFFGIFEKLKRIKQI